MTGDVKRMIAALAMVFCIWSWAAVEARAGILAAAQGVFYPITEMTSESAPDIQAPVTPSLPSIGSCRADQPEVNSRAEKRSGEERAAIDFKDNDVDNKIRIISEVAGKNIVFSDHFPIDAWPWDFSVPGDANKIPTVDIKNMPWNRVLAFIYNKPDYWAAESDNTITIVSAQIIREPFFPAVKRKFTPQFESVCKSACKNDPL